MDWILTNKMINGWLFWDKEDNHTDNNGTKSKWIGTIGTESLNGLVTVVQRIDYYIK